GATRLCGRNGPRAHVRRGARRVSSSGAGDRQLLSRLRETQDRHPDLRVHRDRHTVGGVAPPGTGASLKIDTNRRWHFGRSANADFYEIEPRILAVVPFEGAVDNEATARDSVRIQLEHLRATGQRAGVIVFIDRVLEQSATARTVYREAPDNAYQVCFALVS